MQPGQGTVPTWYSNGSTGTATKQYEMYGTDPRGVVLLEFCLLAPFAVAVGLGLILGLCMWYKWNEWYKRHKRYKSKWYSHNGVQAQ